MTPEQKRAFQTFSSSARSDIRDLAKLGRGSWQRETRQLAVRIVDAGEVLLQAGWEPRAIDQLVKAAARGFTIAFIEQHSEPDEPSQGGRPADGWWTDARKSELLAFYHVQLSDLTKPRHHKIKSALAAWFSAWPRERFLADPISPKYPTDKALRERLNSLIEEEKGWAAIIDRFDEV